MITSFLPPFNVIHCPLAHGGDEMRPRMHIETYKTQPCTDPAKDGPHECLYGVRCNYAHPGEALRRPFLNGHYWDKDYFIALKRDYPNNCHPFGIFF